MCAAASPTASRLQPGRYLLPCPVGVSIHGTSGRRKRGRAGRLAAMSAVRLRNGGARSAARSVARSVPPAACKEAHIVAIGQHASAVIGRPIDGKCEPGADRLHAASERVAIVRLHEELGMVFLGAVLADGTRVRERRGALAPVRRKPADRLRVAAAVRRCPTARRPTTSGAGISKAGSGPSRARSAIRSRCSMASAAGKTDHLGRHGCQCRDGWLGCAGR